MRSPPNPEFLDLDNEYQKLNQTLYKNFSKYVLLILNVIVLFESLEAFFTNRTLFAFITFFTVICTVPIYQWLWHTDKNYEVGVTVVCFLAYFAALYTFSSDYTYMSTSAFTFFFGSSCALTERLIVQMMSKVNQRTVFTLLSMIVKLIILPRIDFLSYLQHCSLIFLSIGLDIYKHSNNRQFFNSYVNSREQLSKFKNLVVQHIPDAITIVSRSLTKNLFFNNAFSTLIKNSQSHIHSQLNQFLIQDEIDKFSSEKDQQQQQQSPARPSISSKKTLLDFLETLLHTNRQAILEHTCIVTLKTNSPENTKLLFEVKIFGIVWDDQESIAIIFHDITEHHTVMSLKIADAQKDLILATVSHELRTPLNGILGMVQIMEKKIRDAELLNFLTICKNSTNLLVSLVSSILDLNQIRANKIQLNFEKIDIHVLLKNIVSLFEYQCSQKGIYLKTAIAPNTLHFLISDKDRLSQILINLVGNAQKFTRKGGITIKACPDETDFHSVKFSVHDTGIGISNEDKHKLFRAFGKLAQQDSAINKQGAGLGLAISQSLVQVLSQGRNSRGITVDSESGKGSIFSFSVRSIRPVEENLLGLIGTDSNTSLPVPSEKGNIDEKMRLYTAESKEPLSLTMLKSPTIQRRSLQLNSAIQSQRLQKTVMGSPSNSRVNSGPSVLLVDDNLFNIAVAEHLVLGYGYQVKTALSGQDAIDVVMSNNNSLDPIVLILMDCQMPIMDGYEATRILKEMMRVGKIREIPIVALTANDVSVDKEACRRAGMCDYLTKPLKDYELARILKRYC